MEIMQAAWESGGSSVEVVAPNRIIRTQRAFLRNIQRAIIISSIIINNNINRR